MHRILRGVLGTSQNAHAVSVSIDNLETFPTDWSLYFTQNQTVAYHYSNNFALARSAGGVTLLQSSGSLSASMWKVFSWPPHILPNVCSLNVY
jgi:hypothetical protein